MMDHKEIIELLPAYLDQELGISDAIAVERHLGNCSECQHEYEVQSKVSALFKRDTAYFKAPTHLARRIKVALPRERSNSSRFKSWNFNWLNAGAVMATLLAVVWSGGLYLSIPSPQERLTEELVCSHIRALQVDHLSDVVSSDRHTVKPWFNGKLNFSPPVIDLAPQGFPLVGGRLDYIGGRTVAVLIYRHNQHPINLYIWPSTDRDAAPQVQNRVGYHLIRWSTGGMDYWVVSDLATNDLESFVGTLRPQI
jgi:anti-sigma factor (TIGR02949 family)